MHPTVLLIFNTWPTGLIWTHPLNQQGSPENKPITFNLELLLSLKKDCNICDGAKLFPSRLNTFHNTDSFKFLIFLSIRTRFLTESGLNILSQYRLSMLVSRAEFKDCDHSALTTHGTHWTTLINCLKISKQSSSGRYSRNFLLLGVENSQTYSRVAQLSLAVTFTLLSPSYCVRLKWQEFTGKKFTSKSI